ncbi:MAG: YceI family protein [Bacteroidales bacterium]|nr:YceI family protein [Bacteroidales bacterium]MDT8432581.1 YceI family protein [Bacteroidales bacterium]
MRKIFLIPLIASLAFACNNPKNADEAKTGDAQKAAASSGAVYEIKPDSEVDWRGVKPTGEHIGTVVVSDGQVKVADGTVSSGSITIDLNSIVNHDLEGDMNARLVGHLKSEDFFYTEQYPTAQFDIVSIREFSGSAAEGDVQPTHEVTGNLTMRGETKSITFPAAIHVSENQVHVGTNEFSIDRTLWGVNFKSKKIFAELKDDFINDMINLKFDVTFTAE